MAAQPGDERLDGGEDLLIVTHPRTMVNSAQSGELTVSDLVRQVAAVARRQPYLLAPVAVREEPPAMKLPPVHYEAPTTVAEAAGFGRCKGSPLW
jgi:hypothetical protein